MVLNTTQQMTFFKMAYGIFINLADLVLINMKTFMLILQYCFECRRCINMCVWSRSAPYRPHVNSLPRMQIILSVREFSLWRWYSFLNQDMSICLSISVSKIHFNEACCPVCMFCPYNPVQSGSHYLAPLGPPKFSGLRLLSAHMANSSHSSTRLSKFLNLCIHRHF